MFFPPEYKCYELVKMAAADDTRRRSTFEMEIPLVDFSLFLEFDEGIWWPAIVKGRKNHGLLKKEAEK